MSLPRVVCPLCKWDVATNKVGRLKLHGRIRHRPEGCDGSNLTIEEIKAEMRADDPRDDERSLSEIR